jgi:hypothetical protein
VSLRAVEDEIAALKCRLAEVEARMSAGWSNQPAKGSPLEEGLRMGSARGFDPLVCMAEYLRELGL